MHHLELCVAHPLIQPWHSDHLLILAVHQLEVLILDQQLCACWASLMILIDGLLLFLGESLEWNLIALLEHA